MAILTKLKKEDFDEILSNYNVGKYKSSKHIQWALENTVFILKTTKGKFVLKIFETADPNFINFQVKTMVFLQKKGVSVQKVIPTKSKKNVLIYEGNRILILKFVEGHEVKRYGDALIKDIAKKQAIMNKNLLKLKLKGKYTWGKDYQFKPSRFFATEKIHNFSLRKKENSYLKYMKKINRKNLKKSVVHGDFHGANILIKENKLVSIIDWGDIHEDYLIHEPAVFITHSFLTTNKIEKRKIRLYLKEYQKHIKLNLDEKMLIYYLIKHRFLGALSYHSKQVVQHKDLKKKLDKEATKLIDRYNNFDKFPLEEFLKLF